MEWNQAYKSNEYIEIPDVVCLEPSGPNYTLWHECNSSICLTASYSSLLKCTEAKNLAKESKESS